MNEQEGAYHYLGTTADGKHAYVHVPPGTPVEEAAASVAAAAGGLPHLAVSPTPPPPVLDMAAVLGKAARQQFYAQRPSGAATRTVTADERVGRNAPCPCGSGLKFKKCHRGRR